jgi:hypothetical protein
MDKDNYTRELLLQTTDICFISYACQLGRVKSLFLDLEEKGHHPVKVMTEKLKLEEKGHPIWKVMPERLKTKEKGHQAKRS